jgi:hypothetical protein
MSDVFREVDEDYRRDRMMAFWRRWGGAVFVLVLLVIAGAFVVDRLHQRAQERKAQQTFELQTLIAGAQPGTEAQSADALAAYATRVDAAHATLAFLAEASLRQKVGALDAAAAIYHRIADNSAVDGDLRDLAVVRLGQIALDQPNPEPLIPRLETIAGGDSPWRYSAREVVALLTARAGQRDKAATMLSDLARDPGAPQDLAQRAHALSDLYSGK